MTIIREDKVGRYIGPSSGSADLENSAEGVDTEQSHQLVNVHNGTADLKMILREEREEKHIKRLQEEAEERGEILVMGKTLYNMPFSYC